MQRMRRTEEKVEKCGFEHPSRATPRGVAGMTEMTRVVGLSRGAAKGQRARAPCLSLKLLRRDEPRIPLTLQYGMAVRGWRGGSQ